MGAIKNAVFISIFRMNMYSPHEGTGKIGREYALLEKIQDTGLGPKPYLLDDSKTKFDRTISIYNPLGHNFSNPTAL